MLRLTDLLVNLKGLTLGGEVRSGPHAPAGISDACRKRALKNADKYFDRLGAIK